MTCIIIITIIIVIAKESLDKINLNLPDALPLSFSFPRSQFYLFLHVHNCYERYIRWIY